MPLGGPWLQPCGTKTRRRVAWAKLLARGVSLYGHLRLEVRIIGSPTSKEAGHPTGIQARVRAMVAVAAGIRVMVAVAAGLAPRPAYGCGISPSGRKIFEARGVSHGNASVR